MNRSQASRIKTSPQFFEETNTIDPRKSVDPVVKAAIAIWDDVSSSRARASEDALRLRDSLRETDKHQAYGWATATCGRIAAYRGFTLEADVLLAEAFGRLFIVNDRYGVEMVTGHLAIPKICRGELDRALELSLQPLRSDVAFTALDRALLHNIAAVCHSERHEFHGAVFQIHNEYELVKRFGDHERISTVLGNLATILTQIGAWELALGAASEAWKSQLVNNRSKSEMQIAHLSNMLSANTHLNRLDRAQENARELTGFLREQELPAYNVMHCGLSILFSRIGNLTSAKHHLEKAQNLAVGWDTGHYLDAAQIVFLEAQGQYTEAIKIACALVHLPPSKVGLGLRLVLASALQRSFKALGDEIEALKWQNFHDESARSVMLGDMLISQIRSNLNTAQPVHPLTERELACLRLAAHGQTSADIGLKLGMKTRTVNFHFSNILRKLNATNRQEAIAKAVSANLLKRD